MVTIGKAELEAIKQRVDLVALVRTHGVELKRTGKTYMGRCPFHDDKTPSFSVDPGKNLWKCFGACSSNGKSGGDAIGFLMKTKGIGFREALNLLAPGHAETTTKRPKLHVVPSPAAVDSDDAERARLLDAVVTHYEKTLARTARAQAYLRRRGLMAPEVLRDVRAGYADGSIVNAVASTGATREKLEALGVLNSEGHEKMTGMVVVPLTDPKSGAVLSLYGRAVTGRRHHYLDGPHRGLVNGQAALVSEELVIVESVIDALSLMVLGLPNVLPLFGTNGWTDAHDQVLTDGAVKRVVLLLDNDKAGELAAASLGRRLAARGLTVSIATLAEHKDPNEALVAGVTAADLRQVLDEARVVSLPPPTSPAEASPDQATAPPRPSLRYETEDIEGGFILTINSRRYRVRGISGVIFERLHANVSLEDPYGTHQDRFDLYVSRARRGFVLRASKAFRLDEDTVERELSVVRTLAETWLHQKTTAESDADKPAAPPELTADEREEALAFLKAPKLLGTCIDHMGRLGYVGEETNKALGYLVIVSRKLEDPLSALLLSQSGAGKSGLSEVLEKLTAPEDVVLFSRLTSNALYYMDKEFLRRKVVVIEERSGSEAADYSIRTLQTRKKLVLGVPVKDPRTGKTRTEIKEVLGPASFIETTAAAVVNHENRTRCFELYLDESEAQTLRIHKAQRRSKTLQGQIEAASSEGLLKLHWNAQRMLKSVRVDIPFVDVMTFPAHWLRTRRDHLRFLNLIEASAFLHQYQRPAVKGSEPGAAVTATVEDYRIVYELAREVLGSTLSDLKRPERELLDAIRALTTDSAREKKVPVDRVTLTQRELRERLGLQHHQVKRLLRELVELEYVEVASGSSGRAHAYRLIDRGDANSLALKGLLTPEELEEKLSERG